MTRKQISIKKLWIEGKLEDHNPDEQKRVQKLMRAIVKNRGRWPFKPIEVVKERKKNRYEILDGWHRTMAAREIGMKKVPAIVYTEREVEFLRFEP